MTSSETGHRVCSGVISHTKPEECVVTAVFCMPYRLLHKTDLFRSCSAGSRIKIYTIIFKQLIDYSSNSLHNCFNDMKIFGCIMYTSHEQSSDNIEVHLSYQ